MRIESLRCFVEVSRRGSFTRAAEELYITQQGLSRSIRVLEEDLGVQLFSRAGRRAGLTKAGRELLPFAEAIVEQEHAMRAKIATVADKGKNDEKAPEISVTEFASNSLFRSLSDEMEQWGLASVMMREHDAESLIEELAEGKTENPALVLVSSDRARELMASESVHFQPLFSLYHVASCTKDLMSPRRRSVSVKELSQMPIAYYNEPLINTLVKQVFGRWWPPKNIVMHSSSMTMVRKAATDGKAVMISDSFTEYLHEGEDDVMTVRIKEAFPSCFGCVTSITKPPTDAQTAFMERLSQMLLAECHSYIARYPSVIE